ncbi:small, acid-soluble spore protein I [[Bacillus] enclensis]|jgi:small acid-soluble spore protein I (minor)|uniref:Small, acid-soluble spore protein I n=2 Tax=Rossellomorea TaxID=2837508 RepID=A0A0V8HMQ8_9BACI|nr:small acid-soluble spore protein SspI [[Bacillus] enclensis]OAT84463.1 small acid-soluble spore protein SspI [Bacillus sp. MKU004]QTC43734.1 small acid-soluble spore protein SspI [Bacillus sp. V3]QWC21907.1 small acid-soluble spore protein SspI [Bacillus haikouensis]KSU63929.1 small, acid-soluble spore protein I [[Bacillus] enclensis]MBH9967027.1 small acid-soluble spore protein SspI [[Bacillus] enclensis]
MNLNLRKAIIHNVSGNSQEELKDTIVDAIQGGEEKTLPGLGVLLEVFWQNADSQEQQMLLETLEESLQQQPQQ